MTAIADLDQIAARAAEVALAQAAEQGRVRSAGKPGLRGDLLPDLLDDHDRDQAVQHPPGRRPGQHRGQSMRAQAQRGEPRLAAHGVALHFGGRVLDLDARGHRPAHGDLLDVGCILPII